jgi:hypothetical protein
MTIRILSGVPHRETANAERFKEALLASEPQLNHPEISVDILCNLHLPERQIDLLILYHDPRAERLQLRTTEGVPIHSFVQVVEVKQHSPDLIRFEGTRILVRYDLRWSDATDQCDEQTYALKRYQETTYKGRNRRQSSFVQRAIWLARAPRAAFDGIPSKSSVPVHFDDLDWRALVDCLQVNTRLHSVKTLVDNPNHPKYHSLATLRELFTHKVIPTKMDLRRVDALTQTSFDAEKTAYIQNLGKGLLMLRGRGGTGKTFALVQIALHLARQGKRTVLLTYNHGLIADIDRSLKYIGERNPALVPFPRIQTRYSYIQGLFVQIFGMEEEAKIRKIVDLSERENERMRRLTNTAKSFEPNFDFALIDEGQDWTEEQRDFMFRLFGHGHVVVVDGVNQFVGQDRCNWDYGDIPINRRHRLRASRRTKAATCQIVAEIARELELFDWDLEPDARSYGGRFTVLVEPDAPSAVERGLAILAADQRQDPTIRAVDNLVCLPSAKMSKGINYAALFDRVVEVSSRDSWRGFDEEDRRTYPLRESQLRAIQYHSCRGMEGWTTLCLGLDTFFDFQRRNPRIDIGGLETSIREKGGLFFSNDTLTERLTHEVRLFAINWLMIPLTRSIDHLVVHLADERSELAEILRKVSVRSPGSIEWIGPSDVTAFGLPKATSRRRARG